MASRTALMRPWCFLAAIVCGLSFWQEPANDPDLGWHLVGGAWISAHHAVPLHDFINSFNVMWHDYHWLGQLALYALYTRGGYAVLRLGLGLVMAYICKLILDIIDLAAPREPSTVFVLGCFLGALTLAAAAATVRPQIVALAVVALAQRRLIQPPRRWELPYLFLLAVLLVNVHIYWVFLPVLWGLYRCVPRIVGAAAPAAPYAWGGLTLLALAGLVSPYGLIPYSFSPPFVFMNYALIWDLFTTPAALKAAIAEFRRSLGVPGLQAWLLLAYIVIIARTVRTRQLLTDCGNTVACLLSLALAIQSRKFLPLFAIMSLPYVARHVGAVVRLHLKGSLLRWDQRAAPVAVAFVLVAGTAIAARHIPWPHTTPTYIHEFTACRHIAGMGLVPRPPRDHIRVVTDFNHGGWCRWVLYQERPDLDVRVTTDGRTQWVPVEHYLAAFGLANAAGDWLYTLKRWKPDVLVLQKGTPLANALALAPALGKQVFEDEHFTVFLGATLADDAAPPAADRPAAP